MNIDRNAKASNSNFYYFIPAGIIISAATVGTRAIKETNRSDTFIKTVKNCAREYTLENKKQLTSFLGDFLNFKSLAQKIDKIGNKKMFALIFGTGALVNALGAKFIFDVFHKK